MLQNFLDGWQLHKGHSIWTWLTKQVFNSFHAKPRFKDRHAMKLRLEVLESRSLLAVDFAYAMDIDNALISDVALGPEGEFTIVGSFQGVIDANPDVGITQLASNQNSSDAFVASYSADRELLWGFSLGGTGSGFSVNSIATDASGNIYIGGSYSEQVDMDPGQGVFTLTTISSGGAFVAKYDAQGHFVWADVMEGGLVSDLTVDAQGNLIAAGEFSYTFDADPGTGLGVLVNNSSTGYTDAFVVKYDSNGNFQWVAGWGGDRHDRIRKVQVDDSGYIYTIGMFTGTVDFDSGTGVTSLVAEPDGIHSLSEYYENEFVVKLNSDGGFTWATNFAGHSYFSDLEVSTNGDVFVSGTYRDLVDFDPGPEVITLPGQQSNFLLKLSTDADFLWVSTGNLNSVRNEFDTQSISLVDDRVNMVSATYPGLIISAFDAETGNSLGTEYQLTTGNIDVSEIQALSIEDIMVVGGFRDTVDFDSGFGEFLLSTSLSNTEGYALRVQSNPKRQRIEGRVFKDLNGSGRFDSSESGIGQVQVYLDHNRNGVLDASDTWTLTAPDGTYQFYVSKYETVSVVPPSDWLIYSPLEQSYTTQ